MNSPVFPEITEALEQRHAVLASGLLERIHGLLQIPQRSVPAMLPHFFFARFPRPFFRILCWLLRREMNHAQARLRRQPRRYFGARMMPCPSAPQNNLSRWISCQQQLQPNKRHPRVLPSKAKGHDLCARAQLPPPRKYFPPARRACASGAHRLFAAGLPPAGKRACQLDLRLVAAKWRHALAAIGKFFKQCTGFACKPRLRNKRTPAIAFASWLLAPADQAQQLAHPAPARAQRAAFCKQLPAGFESPAPAHLRARLCCRCEQRTRAGATLVP